MAGRRERYWGCWKLKPRNPAISPCGYDQKHADDQCRGCADNPRTAKDKGAVKADELTASKWAKRWGL